MVLTGNSRGAWCSDSGEDPERGGPSEAGEQGAGDGAEVWDGQPTPAQQLPDPLRRHSAGVQKSQWHNKIHCYNNLYLRHVNKWRMELLIVLIAIRGSTELYTVLIIHLIRRDIKNTTDLVNESNDTATACSFLPQCSFV